MIFDISSIQNAAITLVNSLLQYKLFLKLRFQDFAYDDTKSSGNKLCSDSIELRKIKTHKLQACIQIVEIKIYTKYEIDPTQYKEIHKLLKNESRELNKILILDAFNSNNACEIDIENEYYHYINIMDYEPIAIEFSRNFYFGNKNVIYGPVINIQCNGENSLAVIAYQNTISKIKQICLVGITDKEKYKRLIKEIYRLCHNDTKTTFEEKYTQVLQEGKLTKKNFKKINIEIRKNDAYLCLEVVLLKTYLDSICIINAMHKNAVLCNLEDKKECIKIFEKYKSYLSY